MEMTEKEEITPETFNLIREDAPLISLQRPRRTLLRQRPRQTSVSPTPSTGVAPFLSLAVLGQALVLDLALGSREPPRVEPVPRLRTPPHRQCPPRVHGNRARSLAVAPNFESGALECGPTAAAMRQARHQKGARTNLSTLLTPESLRLPDRHTHCPLGWALQWYLTNCIKKLGSSFLSIDITSRLAVSVRHQLRVTQP
jgi:hypothetical protein